MSMKGTNDAMNASTAEPLDLGIGALKIESLKSIPVYDALHAIDVELHMVTQYGPSVGEKMTQLDAEHLHTAKAMLELLIKVNR